MSVTDFHPALPTEPPAERTVEAVLDAIDKVGEHSIGGELAMLLLVDDPENSWWVGSRSGFTRPAGHPAPRFHRLTKELIRPIVVRTGRTPEQKIDEIICTLGAICVLCGHNVPEGPTLDGLRVALKHLLAAE